MKTAIVHEWLVNYMGSEKCVESFTNILPDAEIFTLIDFLDTDDREVILKGKFAHTSLIQKLPLAHKLREVYLPLYPFAIENLDVSDYDIILSSSHSVAKGVITRWNQLHICYCHTPMRYAWDLYHQYIKEANLNKGIKGIIAQYILHKLRMWDLSTINRVTYFIANSEYIAKRIKKHYGRNADVIYPPVDVDKFQLCTQKEDFYIAISRFVPYKKMDIIVEAFAQMPEKKLVVIGDGPDEAKIKRLATKNIELLGYQQTAGLKSYLEKAKALVFAAEEDFGITVVESLACGTPVIALDKGGTAETVINNVNGIHFSHQSPAEIINAVRNFEKAESKFDYQEIRNRSLIYSRSNFENKLMFFIDTKKEEFFNNL